MAGVGCARILAGAWSPPSGATITRRAKLLLAEDRPDAPSGHAGRETAISVAPEELRSLLGELQP